MFLFVMGFKFLIHHRFKFIGVGRAKGKQAQIVTHEFHRMMIFHQHRKIGKQTGAFRVFNVAFKCKIAFGFRKAENRIKADQKFQIGGLFLWAFHGANGVGEGFLHDAKRVGSQIGTKRSPENDQNFKRLYKNAKVAMRQIATQDRADYDDITNDQEHSFFFSATPSQIPERSTPSSSKHLPSAAVQNVFLISICSY